MEIKRIVIMRKLKILLFALTNLVSLNLFSQAYTFTAVGGAIAANASPTTIHTAGTDDAISAAINIGFNFQYGCATYTQIKVSSNGWLTFDMTTSFSDAFNDLSGTTDRAKVAPLWDDLAVGSGSTVNYQLTGTAPNRILTIEWREMEWTYSASAWAVGFQVKLYETSNRIEFIYNRNGNAGNNVSAGASASIGLTTSAGFYSLDGVGASPTASTVTETDNLNTKPANSQIYRWDPVSCSGTPTAGSAVASLTSVCGGSTNLSLTGSATGCGITYQWQSSPNNSVWTNIAGATSATLTQTPVATTYYRCIITCSNSGISSNSTSVLVTYTGLAANDNCTGATALTVNTALTCTVVTSGTVQCSSASSQSGCGGTADDDVWFSFVATATSQIITLQNIAGSTTDMYHSLWTGTCPTLTLVPGTCSDPNSQTVTGLTVGQTYFVRVYTWTSTPSQTSTFDICITNPCPTCSGTPSGGTTAATLTVLCGSSTTLSVSGSVTGCSFTYQWQSSTNNSTWTNIPGATSETYVVTPSADIYYRRIVTCAATGNSGTSTSIFIDYVTGPANDDCSGATPITVNTALTCTFVSSGTVNCATASSQSAAACFGTEDDDVWFSFVANAASQIITIQNIAGSTTDMYHSLWNGTCPGLTLVPGTCSDPNSQTVTGLIIGQTYFIRVYTWTSTPSQTSTFDICITNPCPTCSGTPAGGTTNASLTTLCGQSTTLSVTGSVTGCSYTYQWQYSLDNISWTNIVGATGETYVATPNSTIYYRRIVTCPGSGNSGTSSTVTINVTPGPSNDDPCSASALTVGTSCSFSTYTNTCATNSVTTVGAPSGSCASYAGGDVWFTAVVPSGGSLTFDSNTGVITDSGMEIYRGTCGALTSIECDDDDGVGNMSMIAATGLVPGETIWIRFWEFGGNNNGTFSLCVYDPCPPCNGAPTAGTATATPNNTSCGAPNTTLTLAGGSSGCGFTYQWQSSPDNATWSSISGATQATYTTPVSVATYFRCIISCVASAQSSTSNSVLVTTSIANACSFTISTPAYVPDAAYTAGTILTFPDDQMSTVLPIGFSFCFMGTNYTNLVVSSNSFVSFNTGSAGGYSSWVTVPIPAATPVETLNSIMFPWHDIDPSVGVASDIRYLAVGVAPNRKFIVNFSLTPMFSFTCNSQTYTGQLVLNETTNIIETFIQDKPICPSWNGGRAVHGINGPDGCSGVTVAGRNNTVWGSVGINDAKMFTPTGCCNTALSAELLSFEGSQIGTNLNQLNWVSSTETNLDKYIIEKSENGIDFEYLNEKKASGNSSASISYSSEDDKPFDRLTYYRLKLIDFDGSYNYSNTIAINNSNWVGFSVLNLFPNPSNGIVNSEIFASSEISFILEIRDISGRLVKTDTHQLNKGSNLNSYDLTEFEAGMYIFNFIDQSTGKSTSIRLTKD